MKTALTTALFGIAAIALIGCAPPATTNTTTNTNTNVNSAPKAAAPTADALVALDTKAFEAWKTKDAKYFEGFLADNFVGFGDDGKRPSRAEAMKMITGHNCDVKTYALSESHMTPAGTDAADITYKATVDGSCEGQKIPSPVTAATVFVRSGDTWKAAYHNEVAVVATPDSASNSNSTNQEKKSEPAPAAKSETASNLNANSSASSATNTAASGDALTDSLMAMEKKGWEAWMRKDSSTLQSTTSKDVTFVDAMGKVTKGQADVIKTWTDGSCSVSSVDVSDGKASLIAKDVAILTYKGTGVGTCGGMKIEPLWATSVAVKEGDVWKAVYIFETPMRKS